MSSHPISIGDVNQQPGQSTYEAWKHADQRAREAEERLAQAWSLFDSGLAEPPSESLLAEVSRLRQEAHEFLRAALRALDHRREG